MTSRPASTTLLCTLLALAAGFAQGKPIIYSGNTSYPDDRLNEALSDSVSRMQEDGVTRARASDAAFFLERFYRTEGFARAIVDWQVEDGLARLDIEEGPRISLGEIHVEGLESPDAIQTAHEYLLGPTRKRFSRFQSKLPYSHADMLTGASNLQSHYQSQGYKDAKVNFIGRKEMDDALTASPVFSVNRGPRYFLGGITLKGTPMVESAADFPEPVQRAASEPFSPYHLEALKSELLKYYQQLGHYNAKVVLTADPARADHHLVPLEAKVEPGTVYIIGKTNLEKTAPRLQPIVRREFNRIKGNRYNRENLRSAYRQLIQTGVFEYFRVYERPHNDGVLNLNVVAKEAKTKQFNVFLGYENFSGPVLGLGFQDLNLFGNATPLVAHIEVTPISLGGDILYRDPWILSNDHELRLRASADSIEYDGYTAQSYVARAELERRFSNSYTGMAFLQVKRGDLSDAEINPDFLGSNPYTLVGTGALLRYETVDDPLMPTRGMTATLGAEYAWANPSDGFARIHAQWSHYIPVGRSTLALGARASTILPGGDDGQIPINERYFNGGPQSVRSFPYRELGPTDSSQYPVGGLTRTILNAEFIVPVVGELAVAFFADTGSVSRESAQFDPDDLRYAVGAGLRYNLPIGPVRLDYGWNPDRRENEPDGTLHFSFGFAF